MLHIIDDIKCFSFIVITMIAGLILINYKKYVSQAGLDHVNHVLHTF